MKFGHFRRNFGQCSICGGGIEPGTKYMMIAVGNPRKSQKHEPAHPQCAFDLQSKMGR